MDSEEIDWSEPETGKRRGRRLRAVGEEERADGGGGRIDWLKGGSYDPEKFYVRSTDDKGHQYAVKGVNVPQGYAEPMGKILDYFPEYRSYGDIVRDGLVHILIHRGQQIDDGFVTELMEADLSRLKAYYSRLRMETRRGEVDEFSQTLALSLTNKDWSELDRVMKALSERLQGWWDKYPDEETRPYDAYMEEMEGLWKKYAAEMKRVRERGEWK